MPYIKEDLLNLMIQISYKMDSSEIVSQVVTYRTAQYDGAFLIILGGVTPDKDYKILKDDPRHKDLNSSGILVDPQDDKIEVNLIQIVKQKIQINDKLVAIVVDGRVHNDMRFENQGNVVLLPGRITDIKYDEI